MFKYRDKLRIIGDVHTNFEKYQEIANGAKYSVQVGDFGAGYVDLPQISSNHRFIRGNHDKLEVCKSSNNWIPDGTLEKHDTPFGEIRILYIGGAYSIEGKTWDNEELNYEQFNNIMSLHEKEQANIIISHDAPNCAIDKLEKPNKVYSWTQHAFQTLFEIYEPKFWFFGHWHCSKKFTIGNTNFVCLDILKYVDVIV